MEFTIEELERYNTMKVLAIDTSNKPLSVALLEEGQLVATTTTNIAKNHSVTLMPLIEELFKRANWQPQTVDRVVVAQGPGSYTGLRIGVTTAKTFACTLNKELVGVSSLEILAGAFAHTEQLIVPLFDARRNNVFAGGYSNKNGKLEQVIADQHTSLDNLCDILQPYSKIIFVGKDCVLFKDQLLKKMGTSKISFAPQSFAYPQALVLGLLGEKKPIAEINSFVPHYLRLTQAETQWLKNHRETDHEPYVEKI
ncbi:glycoprotein endopeptidase [Liquorilactobacillus sucicola DSM 21376 = JCM 15457]|uniref:Glycoprotein endopeptidase n=2 Tax=Liquorilactobacillus sucicola TaxID=519050 RepID=A0A0R2DZ41_9LACO|nr:glycoprotein endopeptidase [Liquorilactobacillus sucicola DSM 21376 = JCM 15457]